MIGAGVKAIKATLRLKNNPSVGGVFVCLGKILVNESDTPRTARTYMSGGGTNCEITNLLKVKEGNIITAQVYGSMETLED